jgi:hypothetical protein
MARVATLKARIEQLEAELAAERQSYEHERERADMLVRGQGILDIQLKNLRLSLQTERHPPSRSLPGHWASGGAGCALVDLHFDADGFEVLPKWPLSPPVAVRDRRQAAGPSLPRSGSQTRIAYPLPLGQGASSASFLFFCCCFSYCSGPSWLSGIAPAQRSS